MNFIQAYFISSLRFLNIFIMAVVKSVPCASVKLPLSGNFTIGVLDSGGIILSLLSCLCFCTGIYVSGVTIFMVYLGVHIWSL